MRSGACALLLATVVTLPGCATTAMIVELHAVEPLVYCGTRCDASLLATPSHLGQSPIVVSLDLPLSFLLDTALLPFTAIQSVATWPGRSAERAAEDARYREEMQRARGPK